MEPNSTAEETEELHHGNYLPNAQDSEGDPKRELELVENLEIGEEELQHQPLEQEDLNFEKWKPKPKPKKTFKQKMQELNKYLWNPETREFMGRSGKSWSLILLFYSVLYFFLAAMFGACMWALMWSINPYVPTYNDSVIPPGMMMSPRGPNGFDVSFNASDRSSWIDYVNALEDYLKPYEDSIQRERNIHCLKEEYYFQEDEKESAERKACQFRRSWLKECSGLQDRTFGYSEGKPCILLKMNRILGYLPGQGTAVKVTCTAKKGDPGNLGPVDFYPDDTFKLMYFPYYGKLRHVNYTNPLVGVRFSGLQPDTQFTVQCRLHGKGIINDSPTDRFLGSVTFGLIVGE
ncbi:protein ATP1B4 isoform X1 [Paramormyrops kingsleyae]|uniref:Sodium/potassium-transporting ATPase subunit beta n=1 Tax=Paramormyrops kingsleyae TaxID=1676925 RepID=A0A3B3SUV4_9TELE|nr:protein ATP1B4 isoform X1 [Paramormyrops kingsleyae]